MRRRKRLQQLVAFGVVAWSGVHGVAARQGVPSSTLLTPAQKATIERNGAAFVEALNAGATPDWLGLFAAHRRSAASDERLAAQLSRLRDQLGRLEFHHAELAEFPSGGGRSRVLHVFARAAGEQRWKDFQVTIEPHAPFRFDQLLFIADVAEPVRLPAGDLPDPYAKAWLNSYIDQLVQDEDLAGSVLITKGRDTILARTFGYADAGRTVPIRSDTRFSMASASKMFTAVLIARMFEAGQLSEGDTIGRFFPEPATPRNWSGVTVGQLLSHRSGIGEYWTDEFTAIRHTVRALDQYLPWIYKAGETSAPGAAYRYSNSNYILLGLIVERLTGRSYEDELRRVILMPLKMTSTSLTADRLPATRDAEPLIRHESGWKLSSLPPWGSSAGGAMTTVQDATTFLRALASGRLVSPDTLKAMTTPRNTDAAAFPYGYALEMRTDSGTASFGHGGIARGVNAELRYFPSLDVALVMFSNQDNGAYDDLRKNVIKLISGDR